MGRKGDLSNFEHGINGKLAKRKAGLTILKAANLIGSNA